MMPWIVRLEDGRELPATEKRLKSEAISAATEMELIPLGVWRRALKGEDRTNEQRRNGQRMYRWRCARRKGAQCVRIGG